MKLEKRLEVISVFENNNENKKNRVTLLSIMATGPACAVIGYILGAWDNGIVGGIVGAVVGYLFGIFFRKWIYDNKKENHE